MKFPFARRTVLVLICALIALCTPVVGRGAPPSPPARPAASPNPAQAQEELQQAYTSAMNAFNTGDYAAAAAGLEKVVAKAPPDAALESVYFTLGAAYFNLEQYAKAASALGTYRTKFPSGPRIVEATFSFGQASLLTKSFGPAAEAFKTLENVPAYRQRALLLEGTAYRDDGKTDNAIAVFERLVGGKIRDNASANGALLLAGLYSEKKETAKAGAMLGQVRRHLDLLDNIAQFNTLATESGDKLLGKNLPAEALACYRVVNSREETIDIQTARVAGLQEDINRQVALIRADPKNAQQYLATNTKLKTALATATARLEEFKKLPDYKPAVLVRIATCFAQMGRSWETIVAYEELLRRYPEDPTREPATYGLIVASADVGRYDRAHALCDDYLKEFPKGPNADAVGYLTGAMALQANDPGAAETYFGRALDVQKGSTFRETMRFLLGNAQFAQNEFTKAQATYAEYLKEFPKGRSVEEVQYRIALCAVFSGAYEKAVGLLDGFIGAHPKSDFLPDARYRLAVCMYAASQYDQVIAQCDEWEKLFGKSLLLGEVLALKADAQAARGDGPVAVDTYLHAYEVATTTEVVDYAIFAAQKLLQKAGDWPRIGQIFERYVREHPDQPSAVMAVYWIGKARTHEGKTEEAKRFIAETIKKYIADPQRESVEQLLTQLATLCVKKKPTPAVAEAPPASGSPGSPPANAAAASPVPSPEAAVAVATPTLTPPPADPAKAEDPGAELDALLGGAETNTSPLARARVLFAKSELARLRRQTAAQDQNVEAIATGFKPEDLDAPLLAVAGDFLLGKKRLDQAAPLYERLLNVFPKSSFLDYAYNGLGEIAFQGKDYPKALRFFTEAVDKAAAGVKLKDVTMGRARTLLAMNRFDEARKLFEQIAGTREWRGESTAEAVYSLGEIMRRQNKLPEAIAYYQRVYVAYQRFLPWVAKSYVASAQCFEKMGKGQEALNTYREMVKNPKLQNFAETAEARSYLQKNSQG